MIFLDNVHETAYDHGIFGETLPEYAPIRPSAHRVLQEVLDMEYAFITFRSVTFGQRGEKLLKGGGIRCVLQRTPRWMEEQGCGYALRLPGADAARAVQLLRANQVPMRKIYVQRGDGELEEAAL